MDLRTYLRAIRKRWWLVLIVTLLGAGAGVAVNLRATPLYASHVKFYVSTPATTDTAAVSADQFAQRRTNSYVQLLSSERLARAVITEAALTIPPGKVMAEIKGSVQVNTVLLLATVTDPSPARSLRIATALASVFPTMIDDLDNHGSKAATVQLNVVSGPSLSHTPVSPRKILNISVGVLLGLLVGLLLAVLRELFDTTIRTTEVLRDTTGLPVVGSIQFDSAAKKAPLIVGGQVRSVRAEAFRQLRTNLQFVDVDHPVKVIVVTSSVAAEGKSTTAANLAMVFVETGRRVLLIEADLRRPRVSDYLGLDRVIGLTNVLAGQVAIEDVLQRWGTDGLTVLPCGSIPPNPSELLGSQNMIDLVATVRPMFDTIIIDTPPLLPVTDAAVASVLADGVVIVVRHGKTNRTQLVSAVRSLESVDARVLGCVLNMQPGRQDEGRGRYDGYGYYEDARPAAPAARAVYGHGVPAPGAGPHRDQVNQTNGASPAPVEQEPAPVEHDDEPAVEAAPTSPSANDGWDAVQVTKVHGRRGAAN